MEGKTDLSRDDESKLNDAIQAFHLRCAREPEELKRARQQHHKIMNEILEHLTNQGIACHPEYVGSAYEGVKVAKDDGNDDLEFDVMITMKLSDSWNVSVDNLLINLNNAGYSFLIIKQPYLGEPEYLFHHMVTNTGNENYLDGGKAINTFFGELQKWLNNSPGLKKRILLIRHGPAVQMNVYRDLITSDPPYYRVDVVPTLRLKIDDGVTDYVAKPFKLKKLPDPITWRPLTGNEIMHSSRIWSERIDEFTPTHLRFMSEIEQHLVQWSQGFSLQLIGHRAKIEDNESIVFEVLIVNGTMLRDLEPEEISDKRGFFRIVTPCQAIPGRLDSRKETTVLEKHLQSWIKLSPIMNGKVHILRDGSFIKLAVTELIANDIEVESRRPKQPCPLFYVDIIYAFRASDGQLYVARPNDDWKAQQNDMSKAWRRSYSVEAKNAMYGGHGCLKMILRILKVFRNKDVTLAPLTSYHLKTILLGMIKDHTTDWNEKFIGRILMEALKRIELSLAEKVLRDHYVPDVNLLLQIADDCLRNMRKRVHDLRTDEKLFYALLSK